ncbi:MAG TPA: pyridoxal phosphate-dependent aminotransferase [Fimbriimonadaceae bacterium]|nr:pyridoxal phosphate-dependent aminotransferase [Fimbriimonadaceae bacterium]
MTGAANSALTSFPPMGVYEILFKFLDATGKYMGTEGTHPWAQGFPLTSPVPGGPEIPTSVEFTYSDLKYPQATGAAELLSALVDYYREFYGANLTTDNIAIFAGGRPGIYATLMFLRPEYHVLIEETEYTPYWDALNLLGRAHTIVPSNPSNSFRPSLADYQKVAPQHSFVVKSNPCNPTGVTWRGQELKAAVDFCAESGRAGLFDEAYEFFQTGEQDSAVRYLPNIDDTNVFVVSAATKGLQTPGFRVGWVVASKQNIELFRNFSSIAMGGVARPSQIAVAKMLGNDRARHARKAIREYYGDQRERYGRALSELGFELYTGDGGFYHWARLPNGMTAEEFNDRLFKFEAAILPGTLCDMMRRGSDSPLATFVRFSFGPLGPESFESDVAILRQAIG